MLVRLNHVARFIVNANHGIVCTAVKLGLEGEIHACTNHAEVVVPTVHHVPTEITDPANVRCKPNFDTASKLADPLGRGAQMVGCSNGQGLFGYVKLFSLTAAEDRTASRPKIWRNA